MLNSLVKLSPILYIGVSSIYLFFILSMYLINIKSKIIFQKKKFFTISILLLLVFIATFSLNPVMILGKEYFGNKLNIENFKIISYGTSSLYIIGTMYVILSFSLNSVFFITIKNNKIILNGLFRYSKDSIKYIFKSNNKINIKLKFKTITFDEIYLKPIFLNTKPLTKKEDDEDNFENSNTLFSKIDELNLMIFKNDEEIIQPENLITQYKFSNSDELIEYILDKMSIFEIKKTKNKVLNYITFNLNLLLFILTTFILISFLSFTVLLIISDPFPLDIVAKLPTDEKPNELIITNISIPDIIVLLSNLLFYTSLTLVFIQIAIFVIEYIQSKDSDIIVSSISKIVIIFLISAFSYFWLHFIKEVEDMPVKINLSKIDDFSIYKYFFINITLGKNSFLSYGYSHVWFFISIFSSLLLIWNSSEFISKRRGKNKKEEMLNVEGK